MDVAEDTFDLEASALHCASVCIFKAVARRRGWAATSLECPACDQHGAVPGLLQAYSANYAGHAKIDRLIFIADKSQGTAREVEALKMAASELKKVCREHTKIGWKRALGQVLEEHIADYA